MSVSPVMASNTDNVTVGLVVSVTPTYLSEIASPSFRGGIMSVTGITFAVGYAVAGWTGYGCYQIDSTSSFSSVSW